MHHRSNIPQAEISAAPVSSMACISGALTLFLGGVCLADALVAPGLFGPIAAAVVAAERLLCAARSPSPRIAVAWTGIALAWIAVAACTMHTLWMATQTLQMLVALAIAAGALARLWADASTLERRAAATWVIAIGVACQLGILFGTSAAPIVRVAAAAAIELALAGLVRLVDAACLRRAIERSGLRPFESSPRDAASTINLETRLA